MLGDFRIPLQNNEVYTDLFFKANPKYHINIINHSSDNQNGVHGVLPTDRKTTQTLNKQPSMNRRNYNVTPHFLKIMLGEFRIPISNKEV